MVQYTASVHVIPILLSYIRTHIQYVLYISRVGPNREKQQHLVGVRGNKRRRGISSQTYYVISRAPMGNNGNNNIIIHFRCAIIVMNIDRYNIMELLSSPSPTSVLQCPCTYIRGTLTLWLIHFE